MTAAVTAVVPLFIPSTSPVLPVTATFPDGLDHVPPEVVLFNVVVCPAQVVMTPVITAGNGFMVATTFMVQVVGKV